MNEITKVQTDVAERGMNDVTREIVELKQEAVAEITCYVIEIGRRLREAKDMLPHGEWGSWLKDQVQFSQSTAENYMKIFDEYGADQISFFGLAKSEAIGNLPYTKALKLLALPEAEREAFVEENNVAEISTREMDRLIEEKKKAEAERDAANERADELEASKSDYINAKHEAEELGAKVSALEKELEKAEEAKKKAEEAKKKADAKLKELKENPEVPSEVIDKIRSEAEAKATSEADAKHEEAIKGIKEELDKAKKDKEEAERNALLSADRLAEAEKKVKMSSPEAAVFKVRFEEAQRALSAVDKALIDVEGVDAELAEKFRKAMSALVTRYVQ